MKIKLKNGLFEKFIYHIEVSIEERQNHVIPSHKKKTKQLQLLFCVDSTKSNLYILFQFVISISNTN